MRIRTVCILAAAIAAPVCLILSNVTFNGSPPPIAAANPRPRPPAPAPPRPPATLSAEAVAAEGRAQASSLFATALKSPASAVYPLETVRAVRLAGLEGFAPVWVVRGAVDSQNEFAAMMRQNWAIYLSLESGRLEPFRATLGANRFVIDRALDDRISAALDAGDDAAAAGKGVSR